MLQNVCKTIDFTKNMVYKSPPGGGKQYPASGQYTELAFWFPAYIGSSLRTRLHSPGLEFGYIAGHHDTRVV